MYNKEIRSRSLMLICCEVISGVWEVSRSILGEVRVRGTLEGIIRVPGTKTLTLKENQRIEIEMQTRNI